MADPHLHAGLSEPLGDPVIAAIEDALTLVTFSFARPRRHDALLTRNAVPPSWAAWRTQPALYALLDRIVRSRTGRPSHLAAALGLSRSTVSHELHRLEERQLIYRNDFAVRRALSGEQCGSDLQSCAPQDAATRPLLCASAGKRFRTCRRDADEMTALYGLIQQESRLFLGCLAC
jgi:DNA-binding transcriptional ArsR family regulator